MRARLDLVGQVFGRLTVIASAGTIRRHSAWRCRCTCGSEKVTLGSMLKRGHVKSCGCLRADNAFTTESGRAAGSRPRVRRARAEGDAITERRGRGHHKPHSDEAKRAIAEGVRRAWAEGRCANAATKIRAAAEASRPRRVLTAIPPEMRKGGNANG